MTQDATAQDDFIEVYPDALSPAECKRMIELFELSREARPGQVGGGVMPDLKDSDDIVLSDRPEWRDTKNRLNQAVFTAFIQYLRRYRHALIAPLMLRIADPETGVAKRLEADDFDRLPDERLGAIAQHVFRPGEINLQRYRGGKGGYPYWHCELYPKGPDAEPLHRHLLWTIYLNDGFGEGETEFLYQRRKIVPKTGSLLIAPSAFTHTHRGNTPASGDKYIATSWILFQRAEKLYGGNG
ncbi:MAG TPA: 2OG-Fe(II) oxygenase [Xanthomonadales bacterium]|nr:2OG-Fe(II) oxygenase [Xanthomonadales bacterium]